jgi:hypothetical protein
VSHKRLGELPAAVALELVTIFGLEVRHGLDQLATEDRCVIPIS